MSKITNIILKKEKERYWIYIDNEYCTSVRTRTFKSMNLFIGKEISCKKLTELENFHWKNSYGKDSWIKEKIRLDAIKNFLEHITNRIKVKTIGFGADSIEFIKQHPNESGKPDLEVYYSGESIMLIEVSGTEVKRGNDYWVRPDKLSYCKKNPDKNIWIILHYSKPENELVFILPDKKKEYSFKEKKIKLNTEHYVVFNKSSSEVKTKQFFINHLKELLRQK